MVMFSTVSPVSFQNIRNKWVPEIRHFQPNAPIVLVGTKIDIRDDGETKDFLSTRRLVPVTPEDGRKLAEEVGATHYCEISSKQCLGMSPQHCLSLVDVSHSVGLTECFETCIRSVLHTRQVEEKKSRKNQAKCQLF
jgi:GTPase SAR1 family protein